MFNVVILQTVYIDVKMILFPRGILLWMLDGVLTVVGGGLIRPILNGPNFRKSS